MKKIFLFSNINPRKTPRSGTVSTVCCSKETRVMSAKHV